MHQDIALLKEIHGCFDTGQAGAWAAAAVPMIQRAMPHLSSSAALAGEGFVEALDALRDTLESYDDTDPEASAHEVCDRLADVLDLLDSD